MSDEQPYMLWVPVTWVNETRPTLKTHREELGRAEGEL